MSGARRAVLSVTDKTGLIELGRALRERSFELLASGGTAGALRDAGFLVDGDAVAAEAARRRRRRGVRRSARRLQPQAGLSALT